MLFLKIFLASENFYLLNVSYPGYASIFNTIESVAEGQKYWVKFSMIFSDVGNFNLLGI